MRALQAKVVRSQEWESCLLLYNSITPGLVLRERHTPLQQFLALRLVQIEMLPGLLHVGNFKVVHRELQFVGVAHVAILHRVAGPRIARPYNVVDRVHILQECSDALEAVRQLNGNWEQIHAAALLEVSELRDFEAVEHHLPAHAPRAQRGRFPVIFFKLDVVLAQVDANRRQRLQVQLLHILGRRLEDHL